MPNPGPIPWKNRLRVLYLTALVSACIGHYTLFVGTSSPTTVLAMQMSLILCACCVVTYIGGNVLELLKHIKPSAAGLLDTANIGQITPPHWKKRRWAVIFTIGYYFTIVIHALYIVRYNGDLKGSEVTETAVFWAFVGIGFLIVTYVFGYVVERDATNKHNASITPTDKEQSDGT